jgi:hypothetical protein
LIVHLIIAPPPSFWPVVKVKVASVFAADHQAVHELVGKIVDSNPPRFRGCGLPNRSFFSFGEPAAGSFRGHHAPPAALKRPELLFTVERLADCLGIISDMLSSDRLRLALRRSMDTSSILMMAAAVIMLVAVYYKSPAAASAGLSATGSLILEITPRMIAAFTLAGLFQAIVPQELIVGWMGQGSGAKGLLSTHIRM